MIGTSKDSMKEMIVLSFSLLEVAKVMAVSIWIEVRRKNKKITICMIVIMLVLGAGLEPAQALLPTGF